MHSARIYWGAALSRNAPVVLLQEELLEKQDPDEVEPTESDTRRNSYEYADDEAKKPALFEPGRPPDVDLRYPVDHGNEEQEDLNQTALLIKPSHDETSF